MVSAEPTAPVEPAVGWRPPVRRLDAKPDDGGAGRWRRWVVVGLVLIVVIGGLAAAALIVPRLLAPAPPARATPVVAEAPPDGRIVFQSDRETPGQPQIFLMRPDGSSVTRLPISIPYAWHPRFSPDGRRIAFVGRVGGVDDIYLVDVDGRNLQRVTNRAGIGMSISPGWMGVRRAT
jgi:hypothetical protein